MSKTIWVRGRPLRGTIFGLVMGVGVYLLLTKFELVPIDLAPLVATVVTGGVLGLMRAMIGRPYRVVVASEAASEPPPP